MMLEARKLWTLGPSTGVSTDFLYLEGFTRAINVYIQTDGAATATVEMMTSRNSTGPWSVVGSSQVLSTGQNTVIGFTGPWLYMAPRLAAVNSTNNRVFVELVAS